MSLLELAFLNEGKQRLNFRLEEVFHALDTNPAFRIIPLTTEVAHEVAAMGDALRDPGDRVIAAATTPAYIACASSLPTSASSIRRSFR